MNAEAEAAFDAACRRLKASIVLWIRTGGTVVVGDRLNPVIVTIAESAGAMVALADELDIAPVALRTEGDTDRD